MIQISNTDRDIIVRYIEETSETRPKGLRAQNLQRRAKLVARRLAAKKTISQK